MELPELTAYAEEKYHITEEHKWTEFPGFSILADPDSGKWICLLMRQWDTESGTEIQRCDMKCGQEILNEDSRPFLSQPFRMRGESWLGIAFNDTTDSDTVFRLFDCAIDSIRKQGCTIVLETPPSETTIVYGTNIRPDIGTEFKIDIPERIHGMMMLYEPDKDGSFTSKCRNFHIQGRYMEDYEDNAPWDGSFERYFPVYHDMNLRQLRGYFSWRAEARKGIFHSISLSSAYIYIYELLNGIGADSPAASLERMEEFERGFLDKGLGDASMRRNLHRWMLEFAIINDLPAEITSKYAPQGMIEKDSALAILHNPESYTDDEILSALCVFYGKKLRESPAMKKDGVKACHIFAAVWRTALADDSRDIFALCFGKQEAFPWYPLGNAVYWQEEKHPDTDYILNSSRTYRCRDGIWRELRYDPLDFSRNMFASLMHETDRVLRKMLKTGRYLNKAVGDEWAASYVDAAIKADEEASKPEIRIELSYLDRIRHDASITRESLLTEDEMETFTDEAEDNDASEESCGIDIPYREILTMVLEGRSIAPYLRENHLMASIAADAINEALYDEIGDTALECDGDTITIVEEYRDEVLQLIGGKHHGE